jgi:ribosomal subunit interface protein
MSWLEKRKDLTMQFPVHIIFRNCQGSDAVRKYIEERAARLETFCGDILSCRVVVEKQHRHGDRYHVQIDLKAPRKEIVISRDPAKDKTQTDVYVAIGDAFHALTRKLEDFVRERRGDVKYHASRNLTGEMYESA